MMIRCSYTSMICLIVAGLSGCGSAGGGAEGGADDSSWENSQELTQVAEIEFDGGARLEFYEAFEGGIVISGAGPVSSPPLELDHSLTPLQIFKSLAPAREVPSALLEAQLRATDLAARIPERPARASKPAPLAQSEVARVVQPAFGDNDSACPFSWFSSVKCVGAQTCLGYVDGARSIQHDDVKYSIGMTCNYRNGHNHLSQYRTWWSWSAQGTWFVPPGGYRYAELWNATLDYDTRVVVQANGPSPGSHMAMRSSGQPLRVGQP